MFNYLGIKKEQNRLKENADEVGEAYFFCNLKCFKSLVKTSVLNIKTRKEMILRPLEINHEEIARFQNLTKFLHNRNLGKNFHFLHLALVRFARKHGSNVYSKLLHFYSNFHWPSNFNPFKSKVSFLHLWFSDVLREYRNGILG